MKILLHKLAHVFGYFHGHYDAFYPTPSDHKEGRMYMSFVCNTCGKRTGIHRCDDVVDREITNLTKKG